MATATLTPIDDRTAVLWVVDDRTARVIEVGERESVVTPIDDRVAFLGEVGARWCTVEAVVQLAVSAISLGSGEIGDVSNATLDLTWSAAILSQSGSYALGLTVTINGSPAGIASATLQPGSQVVRVVLSASVDANDVIGVSYDSGAGDLVDGFGLAVASASASATNNVGTHLYFDQADDAIHLVTSL